MALEQRAVLEVLPALSGRRVLDLACGTGRYAQLALQRGASQVVGTDSNLAMLGRGSGFPRLRADLTALPFRFGSFDVIICGLALGHLPPDRMPTAIEEMSRVVDRGALWCSAIFIPTSIWPGIGERLPCRMATATRSSTIRISSPTTSKRSAPRD